MRDKPYTEEFKRNIIRLHIEDKRTFKSLSKEYGVSVSTLSRWLITYRNKHAFDVATKKGDRL